MNSKEIEVVCELVNYKNFADAAYSLSYSPSVITKYVSNVEQELGLKLFIRSRKSSDLMVTPEGKIMLQTLRRCNDSYQYMMSLARQLGKTQENTLCIGSQARLGNLSEQEILAYFWDENPDTEICTVHAAAEDLLSLLRVGKSDALFLSLHKDLNIDEFLQGEYDDSDLTVIYMGYDNNMYFGISEAYLPGVYSAPFKAFKDFTFALPFRATEGVTDNKAFSTFEIMAAESGFPLKTMRIDNHINSVFKLATMRPIAVSSTNNVTLYNGIKFVRVEDWSGGTNRYFIFRNNNRKDTLRALRRQVENYLQHPSAPEPAK